jgi:hypothetical protein
MRLSRKDRDTFGKLLPDTDTPALQKTEVLGGILQRIQNMQQVFLDGAVGAHR